VTYITYAFNKIKVRREELYNILIEFGVAIKPVNAKLKCL
jgi:hypothetical protein